MTAILIAALAWGLGVTVVLAGLWVSMTLFVRRRLRAADKAQHEAFAEFCAVCDEYNAASLALESLLIEHGTLTIELLEGGAYALELRTPAGLAVSQDDARVVALRDLYRFHTTSPPVGRRSLGVSRAASDAFAHQVEALEEDATL